MMEALSKIESIPSKVERYRIFLGNAGVVLESGLPLPNIVSRAKGLFDSATRTPELIVGHRLFIDDISLCCCNEPYGTEAIFNQLGKKVESLHRARLK